MNNNAVTGQRMVTDMVLLGSEDGTPVRAELRYYRRDPLAVEMLLSIAGEPAVSWVFGRDLLIEGLRRPCGIGDVRLFPVHESVIITLRSITGKAVLLSYLPDLDRFVDHILSVVPAGTEITHHDIDREIIQLTE